MLQEIGAPFERVDAGMAYGVVNTPQYQAMNPNALVPTLEHGSLVLWESNVIVRYLSARFSEGHLYPTSLAQRFEAERWMDWQQTTFNRASGAAFVQWIRTPAEQRDHAAIARSVEATEPLLHLLDQLLQGRVYIAGDEYTMADIPLACEAHRWFGLPQPRPPLPHLERWYQSVLQRPAARGVLDIALA